MSTLGRVTGLGVRELRADLAARVRRAAAGETTVITVNGRPAAHLGPPVSSGSSASGDPATAIAHLVASGALLSARRSDHRVSDRTVDVWGTVRLDRLLREIRG